MADDDWRRKRAEELGLIDTGPWLGANARRPQPPGSPPLPERRDPSPVAPVVPVAAEPAATPGATTPATPPPPQMSPPPPPLPPPPPTAKSPLVAAPAPRRPETAPKHAAAATAPRRIAPWQIGAGVVAALLAFAIGWLLRDVTAPSAFDVAMVGSAVTPPSTTRAERATAPPERLPAPELPAPEPLASAPPPATAAVPEPRPIPVPTRPARDPALAGLGATRAATDPRPVAVEPPAPAPARPVPAASQQAAVVRERAPVVRGQAAVVRGRAAVVRGRSAAGRPRPWTPPRAVAAPGRDFKPSFNCRRATATITRMICEDAELAALDREMSSLFIASRRNADIDTERSLDAEQADFLNARSGCISAACVERSYRNRIRELR